MERRKIILNAAFIIGATALGAAQGKLIRNYYEARENQSAGSTQPVPLPTRVPPATVRGESIPAPLPPTYLTPEEYNQLRISRSGSAWEKFSYEVSKVIRELGK